VRSVEPYVVVTVVGVGIVLFWLWTSARARRRERAVAASRSSDTVETFVSSFRPEVQPVARAMYVEFQKYVFSGNFPFRKSDVVGKTLNIGASDLEDGLRRVMDQFGCRKPTADDATKFKGRNTFEDYAEFINHLKGA